LKLTSHTQYAIRMLMYCAKKDGLSTTKEIAKFYNLPDKFILKVLYALSKTPYIITVRGRNGGFRLAMAAQDIPLGEAIKTIEHDFELAECFKESGGDCPLTNSCGLNEALSKALQSFFDALNEYSIHDIATKNHNIGVLLKLQEAKKAPFIPKKDSALTE